jgi:predicted DCC family thiol-disulfide oxidoreductase YuxK
MPIGWRFLRIGIIFPKFFLDWFYDLIAKYRYKIFGKKVNIPIPPEELQDRFL